MAPLHYAAKGHPRCVTLLLQQGANVNAVNKVRYVLNYKLLDAEIFPKNLMFLTQGRQHTTALRSHEFSTVDGSSYVCVTI